MKTRRNGGRWPPGPRGAALARFCKMRSRGLAPAKGWFGPIFGSKSGYPDLPQKFKWVFVTANSLPPNSQACLSAVGRPLGCARWSRPAATAASAACSSASRRDAPPLANGRRAVIVTSLLIQRILTPARPVGLSSQPARRRPSGSQR